MTGLTKRRRADGPDDGSADTPRRRAGQRNRDEAMDAWLVVEKYLTTGLHAFIILFITNDILPTNSIHLKNSSVMSKNVTSYAMQTAGAPEAVWQVWRPPYQSKIWYGDAIPIKSRAANFFINENTKFRPWIAPKCVWRPGSARTRWGS